MTAMSQSLVKNLVHLVYSTKKCGTTEIKNLAWIVTLGAVLFCVNGFVKLILAWCFSKVLRFGPR